MSVCFVVVPAIAASWPVLCGAVAAATGAIGYRTLRAASDLEKTSTVGQSSAQVTLNGSELLAESMQEGDQFAITNDDVTAVFRRAADGRCTVHVSAPGRTQTELEAIGRDLMNRVTQQYAYNKIVTQMKSQGFTVNTEEVAEDQTIRIRVSKYV